MSRRLRLHLAGGTYYVVQTGTGSDAIFRGPGDYRHFEHLLAAALRRTRSILHAYCWLPDSLHCVVRIDSLPIGSLMQTVTAQYARWRRQGSSGARGHLFGERYRATLLDPDEYLLPLVRYLHHLPVLRGYAQSAKDHPYTSDPAYRSLSSPAWLRTRDVQRLIECPAAKIHSYAELMATPPSSAEVRLFERGGDEDPRVVGRRAFLASLPRQARTYRTSTTLDQVIDTVSCRLGVERELVLSRSRERELALARALVAWYATERRIAPLAEVARRLRRDPSTLSSGIRRHRRQRPELFDVAAMHDLAPLASPLVRGPRWSEEDLTGKNDAAHP